MEKSVKLRLVLRKSEDVPYDTLKVNIEGTDLCTVWALESVEEGNVQVHYIKLDEFEKMGITQGRIDEKYKETRNDSRLQYFSPEVAMFRSLFDKDESTLPFEYDLLVLSNTTKTEGAVSIAFPEVRKVILKTCPSYRIVIPSSIHEIVLVRKDFINTEDATNELYAMISSVNSNPDLISADEVLSSNAYYIEDNGDLRIL